MPWKFNAFTGTLDYYESATDIINYADSPMIVTGGEITVGTNAGTFKVAALTALLRATDSLTGVLTYITLAEQDNQTITAANTTYIVCLDYNGGTPQIVLDTTNPYTRTASPDRTQIPIGRVMKNGSDTVHYISGGFNFQDGVRKLHMRAKTLRDNELASGSAIAYSGTNNFTMTTGIAYGGLNKITFDTYNSASTQFTAVHSDGGAGWTENLRNTIDYEHYDDGDGTVGDVGNAKYGVHWVYRHIADGHVYVMYGTSGTYSLAQAEAAEIGSIPDHLTDFGLLIGKIVAPQAGGSFSLIQMVSDTIFTAVNAADHNNLGGLQGGTTDEYYHLTSAQSSGASTTVKGPIEIATAAEMNSFSNDSRAMNYYQYSQAYVGWKTIIIKCIADDTALTTGNGKGYVTIPGPMTGFDLVDVGVHIYTASSSGLPSFQIHNLTDTSDMLSTNATIAENENDSMDAATPPVIDTAEDDVVVGDVLRIDCDAAGTGTKGCEVRLIFRDRVT